MQKETRERGRGRFIIIVAVLADSVKVLDVCVVLHASVLCIAVRALVFKLGPIEASAEMLKRGPLELAALEGGQFRAKERGANRLNEGGPAPQTFLRQRKLRRQVS